MAAVFTDVAALDDIPKGSCKALSVGTTRVIVAHLADGFYAVENRCSHANSPLLTGKIYHGRQVACPIHGARFDLKTGAAKSPPAFTGLMMFPVRVVDGRIEVAVPPTNVG
ncbi:MAG TPA: Rieske (2Fe-2S) protein [Alphaproteobacteria bacterium]|jgi:3-phenylpropionate/trans-cinnamate dioxygenase ferredoxin subunit|nr:Rieske (2Fe-2S) protein [Alphaproteobacteria bacterium]